MPDEKSKASKLKPLKLNSTKLRHVAIIMDGNGRWANSMGQQRTKGHSQGATAAEQVIEAAQENAISHLTLFAFSHENWNRPKEEVDFLMALLQSQITDKADKLAANNIKLNVIGDLSKLSEDVKTSIGGAIAKTMHCNGLKLTIALSYGGRQEIVRACRKVSALVKEERLKPQDINEEVIQESLYTSDLPEPDLMIRTGGEKRISNFLLWQMAYTELFFTDVFWPDFGKEQFNLAIQEYYKRERRYGNTNKTEANTTGQKIEA